MTWKPQQFVSKLVNSNLSDVHIYVSDKLSSDGINVCQVDYSLNGGPYEICGFHATDADLDEVVQILKKWSKKK